MVVVVGLVVLSRHGWRHAAFHTAPLAVVYGIWTVTAPPGRSTAKWKAGSAADVKFVGVGVHAAFVSLGEYSVIGLLPRLVAHGLALAFRAQGRSLLRGPAAVTVALLVGALLFLVLTAAFRCRPTPSVSATSRARARTARAWAATSTSSPRSRSPPVATHAPGSQPAMARAHDRVRRASRHGAVPGNLSKFAGYWGKPSYIPTVRENLLAVSEISPFPSDSAVGRAAADARQGSDARLALRPAPGRQAAVAHVPHAQAGRDRDPRRRVPTVDRQGLGVVPDVAAADPPDPPPVGDAHDEGRRHHVVPPHRRRSRTGSCCRRGRAWSPSAGPCG